jgi:hypothetical protein
MPALEGTGDCRAGVPPRLLTMFEPRPEGQIKDSEGDEEDGAGWCWAFLS